MFLFFTMQFALLPALDELPDENTTSGLPSELEPCKDHTGTIKNIIDLSDSTQHALEIVEMPATNSQVAQFLTSRFGVSFHWGLYSILARGEWVRSKEFIPHADYAKLMDRFTADRYDPRRWAEIVKASGARYAVLTAKHHDGFCLWDTDTTDFKCTNSGAKRDLMRDYVDAFREAGLGVGIYFSLVDWFHEDYPHFGDRQHPERENADFKHAPHQWERYVDYMHRQIEELLTRYGELNQIVFDFSYWNFQGEKWGAPKIIEMLRRYQPKAVFNDRLGGDINGVPKPWVGDYDSPELNVPYEKPVNAAGEPVPFEAWITLNNSWGYTELDRTYKQPGDVIRTLVNCVSKGGNLLVNLSPDARGAIPPESVNIMRKVGEWLELNGESIFGAREADLPKPEWGRWTRNDTHLFAHILELPTGHAALPGLRGKVADAQLLATGSEAFLTDFWNYPVQRFGADNDVFLNWVRPVQFTMPLPDPFDTVVRLRLTDADEEKAICDGFRSARTQLDAEGSL
jgi:alpha-L-fucosidase